MPKLVYRRWLAVLLLTLPATRPALAAGKGQDDLDKATETRLAAITISDLGEVIRLADSALQKGLDEANTSFAKKLLASTHIQRAEETTKHIFTDVASPDDFRQRRQFALTDLEKAIQLDPKQPQAYLLSAQLQMLPGGSGVKEVRDSLDKAIELGVDDPALRAKALVMRANLQEKPEKKLADYDEAVRLTPHDAATIRARGAALADMDRLEPALADLNRALALEPDDGLTHEAKALVLARLKRYDEALAALDRSRQLSPESPGPLVQRARIHLEQGKPDAALDDLNQACNMDPGNVAVLMLRSSVYQMKGDRQKALADLEQTLRLKPDLPVALRAHAALLAEERRLDEAAAELERLRKLDPHDGLALLQLGMIYNAQKKSAKAIELYSIIIKADPKIWQALHGRADAYLNLGRHAEAAADYEQAIKLQAKDYGLLNNFAWILATSPDDRVRNGKRAVKLATEACELTQYKAGYIISTLAAAYAEAGDFPSALKWNNKAIELSGPDLSDELKKESQNYLPRSLCEQPAVEKTAVK